MDQGDIALVRFRGRIPEGYHTVPLAKSDKELRRGRTVILAGYGIADARRKTGSGILRKTQVEIRGPRPGKSEMILDQTQGHGACHGDSGGPAFIRSGGKVVLAGITNRGFPPRSPDDCAHKVVYTKVSSYAPWINEASHSMRATKARISRNLPMGKRALKKLVKTRRKPREGRRSSSGQ